MSLNIWFCDRWNKWNILETDFMYDKTNVATFPVLSLNNSVTILLNNSALTKSSKVFLQGLFPKTFVRPVNPWSTISNPAKSWSSQVISTIAIIQQGVSLVQNFSCTLKELINASPKIWKNLLTFHFLKSELDQYIERFFVQVHASAKMMSIHCLYSGSACYYSSVDTPFFNTNTIGTIVYKSLLDK